MATLRALECLVAVADFGSITQAAAALHSSQPAVSHQLAALEREAGAKLLRREPRGVRLTPAGRVAVTEARRAIDAATAAVRSARAASRAGGGALRLATAQSLVSVLAPVLGRWHREHRDVAISVRESTSPDELHGFLDADEVDLVLMPGPGPDRFTATPVAEEEIVLVAPTDHELAARSTVSLQDLDGACLVHFAPANGLSEWLDRALTRAEVRVQTVMRTAVTSAAPQLAAVGLGLAVCPVSALTPGFRGAVRSFAPRWIRSLDAVTRDVPDQLTARFIADLRSAGVPVPEDVRDQLAGPEPARTEHRKAAVGR